MSCRTTLFLCKSSELTSGHHTILTVSLAISDGHFKNPPRGFVWICMGSPRPRVKFSFEKITELKKKTQMHSMRENMHKVFWTLNERHMQYLCFSPFMIVDSWILQAFKVSLCEKKKKRKKFVMLNALTRLQNNIHKMKLLLVNTCTSTQTFERLQIQWNLQYF